MVEEKGYTRCRLLVSLREELVERSRAALVWGARRRIPVGGAGFEDRERGGKWTREKGGCNRDERRFRSGS